MNPITTFLVFVCVAASLAVGYWTSTLAGLVFFAVSPIIATSLTITNIWQKFVILRMGKLQSVKGTGLSAIIPVLDELVAVIDVRIQNTVFNAEQALTKDGVPVNGDADIFWHVHDADKGEAADTYAGHPGALQLRAMNIIYETTYSDKSVP
jgi:regulator of protease activity HflC (stomatin/prohibitin superfamily)